MSRQRREINPVRRGLVWVFRIMAGVFVAAHIYALILKIAPIPATANMVMDSRAVTRQVSDIEAISPYLVLAVIAAEDTRFCTHHGVDTEAVKKVLEERKSGKGLRGGSTITQQTAKNVFLWNGGGFARKGAEAWMASFIDFTWGKRRVMEAYLNVAEWGDGIYGAEAAAQARFGKPASELNAHEAALLAAVLPSPNKWRLDPPGPYVSRRAGTIEARMRVVAQQGLATCVLSENELPDFPAPRRPGPKEAPKTPEPDAPDTELPDLEPMPELAVSPAPETGAGGDSSALSDVIEAADEVFGAPEEDRSETDGDEPNDPATFEAEMPENSAAPDLTVEAPLPDPAAPAEPAPNPEGPRSLLPAPKETPVADVPEAATPEETVPPSDAGAN